MSALSILVLVCHYFLVALLCIYGAHRIHHALIAQRHNKVRASQPDFDEKLAPKVTIQAPVFNERFVIERLIDALAAMDYPKDRLQIQIVDDSTDDSIDIAASRIAYHRERGIDIEHVRRESRGGFKAGALDAALETATGEYVAIFDADFVPGPEFLKETIPHFSDPKIGMVQTRWHHLNIGSNILTRVQAIMLDAHFGVEQIARYKTGAFFNFNGTAGIWRRETISDAGGWRADTLTEDLDLSYRAQLKGWKFVYARDVGCPSELPVDMCAFKTQQHRWAKGAIEVMKKTLMTVWRSPLPRRTKIETTFHLTGNVTYLLMLIDSLFFLLPSVHIRESADLNFLAWLDIPLFFLASLSHAWFFLSSQKLLYGRVTDKLTMLPILLATSIGLGVNNGRAVLEALVGHVTGFVRTPKTGDLADQVAPTSAKPKAGYKALSAKWADRLEVFLAAAYLGYLVWAILRGYYIIVPFMALFAFGFMFTGLLSMKSRNTQLAPV